jgi:hypothetical protein
MKIAHGDIILKPLTKTEYAELMKNAVKVEHNGRFVLAEGETTGHKHVLTVTQADTLLIHTLPDGRGRIFQFSAPGTITHEEHAPLTTTEEFYIQEQEQEYDWFEKAVRKVVD